MGAVDWPQKNNENSIEESQRSESKTDETGLSDEWEIIVEGFEFVRGEKCRFIKSENLELADDLYMTKKYEDKYIIVSEKAIAAKKKDTKEDIMLTISHFCPNAMAGHTAEMLTYLEEQRKAYKNEMV